MRLHPVKTVLAVVFASALAFAQRANPPAVNAESTDQKIRRYEQVLSASPGDAPAAAALTAA